MDNDVIGRSTVEVVADATQLRAGMAEAKKSVQDFSASAASSSTKTAKDLAGVGDAATQTAERMDRAGKRFIESLDRQAATIGKTKAEVAAWKAEQLGLAASAAPFIQKIREAEAATQSMGVSAGQTANAMRMLPAQMTDVVTQLAGGQSPFLVMIQQGGQVKDMFGGIGPMFAGLASFITPAAIAGTAAAAAFGAIALSWKQGRDEALAYGEALAVTNGYVGKTTSQLQEMARTVAESVGTQHQAAEALTSIAEGGKLAGDGIATVAAASVAMQVATGAAIAETVKEYESLADGPAQALAELNSKYHFLTASVYEQIASLEEQGRTQDAVALAIDTLARAHEDIAARAVASTGSIERGWMGVKEVVADVLDSMRAIGREKTTVELLAEQRKLLADIHEGYSNPLLSAGVDKAAAPVQARIAELQALLDKEAKSSADKAAADQQRESGLRAAKSIDALADSLDKAGTKQKELTKLRQQFIDLQKANPSSEKLQGVSFGTDGKVSGGLYDTLAKGIEDKYKPKATKAYQDDGATRYLAQLKEQQAALQAQLEVDKKLTDAQKEKAKFEQQIADLKDKKVLTADQKSLVANQEAIRAQLDKNVAVAEELRTKNEQLATAKKQAQIQKELDASVDRRQIDMASARASQQEQYDRSLSAFGHGSQEWERAQSEQSIRSQYQRYLDQSTKSYSKAGQLDSHAYRDEQQAIRGALADALADQRRYYSDLDSLRGDWKNGSTTAFADYLDSARDVSKQTQDLFGNAFSGMEDAIVQFATTGKASFSSFAASVLADMARIAARQATVSIISAVASAWAGSGSSSSAAGATGSFGGGSTAYAANGAAFAEHGRVTAFARGGAFTNSVVSSPTPFRFAAGGSFRNGLMGEAGPEAIMPLRRTSDGKLGVVAAGGGQSVFAPSVQVNVQQAQGESAEQTGQKVSTEIYRTMQRIADERIVQAKRYGGALAG